MEMNLFFNRTTKSNAKVATPTKRRLFGRMLKSESGQGATEYILLLVVVVALVLMFKDQIKKTVSDKIGELNGMIGSVGKD